MSSPPGIPAPSEFRLTPASVEELAEFLRSTDDLVVLRGSAGSAAGHTSWSGATTVDLSALNHVVRFEPLSAVVRVQAGMRWLDLLRFLGPHGLVPTVMPCFYPFTVGGCVASNAFGMAVGKGPVSSTVRALRVLLADGTDVEIGPQRDPELFAAVVGGYGGVAVVVEVELQLERNAHLRCVSQRVLVDDFVPYFRQAVLGREDAVLHATVLYGPDFRSGRASTWVRTTEALTHEAPIRQYGEDAPLRHVVPIQNSGGSGWLQRHWQYRVIEPMMFHGRAVHWHSYEAVSDLRSFHAEFGDPEGLEVQEFVIGLSGFDRFMEYLRAIVADFEVPVVQLMIRPYGSGSQSWLSLAYQEDAVGIRLVARTDATPDGDGDLTTVWSWALLDAVIECGGRFHPGYQIRATREQFEQAFPDREMLLEIKNRSDPQWRFGNLMWDAWLVPQVPDAGASQRSSRSEFRAALAHRQARERLFDLVVTCSPRGDGYRLFAQLENLSGRTSDDRLVYRSLLRRQMKWEGAVWRRLWPARMTWRHEHERRLLRPLQRRLALLPGFEGRELQGVAELGGGGSFVTLLRREYTLHDPVVQVSSFGVAHMMEALTQPAGGTQNRLLPARLQPRTLEWDFVHFNAPPGSLSLVVAAYGLNSLPYPALRRCLEQVARALRPGGMLLVVDYDADTALQGVEASVAITLLQLCAGLDWDIAGHHPRTLRAAEEWAELLAGFGLEECLEREGMPHSPAGDVLMTFRRTRATQSESPVEKVSLVTD